MKIKQKDVLELIKNFAVAYVVYVLAICSNALIVVPIL